MRTVFFKNTCAVTTAGFIYHVSSLLAQGGHTVLMVDADPQCNLTSLLLQSYGESGLEEFYEREPSRNIYAGLSPIFKQDPALIIPIECFSITRRNDLYLLPGNVRLIEYEERIVQCLDLPGSAPSPLPYSWALSNLIDVTARHHNADLVLVDVGANTGMFNRDILMTSDHFMIMAAPGLSSIALDVIPSVFVHWHAWYEKMRTLLIAQSPYYPGFERLPRFLGMIFQKLCPRDIDQEKSMKKDIKIIRQKVKNHLVPALRKLDMIVPESENENVVGLYPDLFTDQLPEISDRISKA